MLGHILMTVMCMHATAVLHSMFCTCTPSGSPNSVVHSCSINLGTGMCSVVASHVLTIRISRRGFLVEGAKCMFNLCKQL